MAACGQGWNLLQEDSPPLAHSSNLRGKGGLRDERPPYKLLRIVPWMPGSSTETPKPYKDQLWLACSSPARLRGPYRPSAPRLHAK